MYNNLLKKMLVFGTILLFFGAIVAPSISSINLDLKKESKSIKNSTFNPFKEGWKYRKKVTIDHSQVAGDLLNFPILVSIIDPDLRDKAQADGDDILFMNGKGEADQLYHEIEYYNGSMGKLVAWLNIPALSSVDDVIFYMFYGNPNCINQEVPEMVWDSDYIHIWHMGEQLNDCAGLNNGTNYGTTVITGKVGKARDFEKNEHDYITCGDMIQPADNKLITMTWEAWVKPETQDGIITSKYDSSGADYSSYSISFIDGGRFKIQANSQWDWPGRTRGYTDDSWSVVGQWVHLTGTFALGNLQNIDIFINGDQVAVTQDYSNADYMWNVPVTDDIGRIRMEDSTNYADAVIDEIRWSKIVRSDAWIKTSYNTMNNPSTFLTFGPEEKPRQNPINIIPLKWFVDRFPNAILILRLLLGF